MSFQRSLLVASFVLAMSHCAARAQDATSPPAPDPAVEMSHDDLEVTKLRTEIDKLAEEVVQLRAENEAIGTTTRWFISIMTAIGGIVSAIIAGAATFALYRFQANFQRSQTDRLEQDKQLQADKLEQDKLLERMKFNHELFKGIAHANQNERIASAAILLSRLDRSDGIDADERLIAKVLVSALKDKQPEGADLRKYVADNLFRAIGAIVPKGKALGATSALATPDFDLQQVQLASAFLERLDGRAVDFFLSSFKHASLRSASLQDAQLVMCDLESAVLVGADLSRANLSGANLSQAKLSGAVLTGAKFDGAVLTGVVSDATTVWPDGFAPPAA